MISIKFSSLLKYRFQSIPIYCCRIKFTGCTIMNYVGFEVLTAVSTKMAVFWVVAPCSLVDVYQRFRGPCCLHHQGDDRQKTAIFVIMNYDHLFAHTYILIYFPWQNINFFQKIGVTLLLHTIGIHMLLLFQVQI
jgi:hypothetical protein